MLKVWLIRLSVLCNILVLAVVAVFWTKPNLLVESYLKPLRDARISIFAAFPVAKHNVVFLGDSITHSAHWEEMFPRIDARNRGTSGDTTTNILDRLDQVIDGQPKAVFLKIGTNDLTHGPSDREVSYSQYRDILQRIQAGSPNTQIFTQSILPREVEYREEVEAFNQKIKTFSLELGLTYIDLYPSFLHKDGSIEDSLTYDELHLNGKGYQQWQALLQSHVDAL